MTVEIVTGWDAERLYLHDGRDNYSLDVPGPLPDGLRVYDAVEYEQDEEGAGYAIRIVGNYETEVRAMIAEIRHGNERGEG